MLTRKEVELKAGEPAHVSLASDMAGFEGVLTVTVIDAKGMPVAERLVYRVPSKSLKVTVTADKKTAVPGDKVSLTVKTTDAAGKPVSAVVGVSVTDDCVLKMIEKRERAPRLAAMALLEGDVKELADAEIYFDPADAKSAEATDLLLGTQGWRRFALLDTAKFLADGGDAARRALAVRIVTRRDEKLAAVRRRVGGGAAVRSAALPVERSRREVASPRCAAAAGAARRRLLRQGQGCRDSPTAGHRPLDSRAREPRACRTASKLRGALDQADEAAADRASRSHGDRLEQAQARNDLALVRVFAHDLRPDRKPNDRVDFAETLYWAAGVKTDDKTGEATVSFALSDSVTGFAVSADGFAADGAIGQGDAIVESVRPFYIEPKLPLEVTSGDRIILPVGAVNGAGDLTAKFAVTAESKTAGWAGELKIGPADPLDLKAGARGRRNVGIEVGTLNGSARPHRLRRGRRLLRQGRPQALHQALRLPRRGRRRRHDRPQGQADPQGRHPRRRRRPQHRDHAGRLPDAAGQPDRSAGAARSRSPAAASSRPAAPPTR